MNNPLGFLEKTVLLMVFLLLFRVILPSILSVKLAASEVQAVQEGYISAKLGDEYPTAYLIRYRQM